MAYYDNHTDQQINTLYLVINDRIADAGKEYDKFPRDCISSEKDQLSIEIFQGYSELGELLKTFKARGLKPPKWP